MDRLTLLSVTLRPEVRVSHLLPMSHLSEKPMDRLTLHSVTLHPLSLATLWPMDSLDPVCLTRPSRSHPTDQPHQLPDIGCRTLDPKMRNHLPQTCVAHVSSGRQPCAPWDRRLQLQTTH